jgi:hypothetical protein
LKVLITDGFQGYQTFAKSLNRDIIHVRHIHRPPYGMVEIDLHHYDRNKWYKVSLRTTNDMLFYEFGFYAEVKLVREKISKEICNDYPEKQPKSKFSIELDALYKILKNEKKPCKWETKKWVHSKRFFFILKKEEG